MTIPDPKHYWNFNETGGTTAADAVGGAVIALDRASWVPGRVGNAIRFNRKDGAKLATTSLPEVPPPWTVTFWVMREEDCDGAAIFSSPHYGLKLEQWENTHQVGFTKYSTSTIQGFDPSFDYTAPLKQWVHLALVMGTDNKLRRYVNGKGNDFREVQEPINLGLRWLGSTQGYTEFASAIFDEIKVFDQALTDEQVKELAGSAHEGFVGVWTGSGKQTSGSTWTIQVTIDDIKEGIPQGKIAYPSLNGLANLEFVTWEGDTAVFQERYTQQGNCVPNGYIRLRLTDAKTMDYRWSGGQQTEPIGTGTLTRTS